MSQFIRGTSGWNVAAGVIDATTGAGFVGTVTCYVEIDGGAQTLGSVASGVCTAKGNGVYLYQPTAAETAGDNIIFTFVGTGAIPATIQVATVTAAQQSALTTASGFGAIVVSDMVTEALEEIRAARAGDVINPEDMDLGLRRLNRILNLWNADDRAVYAVTFDDYTLTPALSPHTIGPSGTFDVTMRPVSLEYAALNLGGSPAVFAPITVRDRAWYQQQGVPGVSITTPTDVYYEPGWTLGSLYFYGVPSVAYSVRLWTNTLIASVALTDTFSLPPGYQEALTLTLAEALAPAFGQRASEETKDAGKAARALIFDLNNTFDLNIHTNDAGMPSSDQNRSGYDYLTGTIR